MLSYNPYYEKYLMHYGIAKKSGRYPYGSGDRPYQHEAGGAYKKKYARRTNKFLKAASKKKVNQDYKEGKISQEERNDLRKGIKTVYKNEKSTIKQNKLGMSRNEYYQNTTGEFRDVHSKSRIAQDFLLVGGWIPNGIRHISLSKMSQKYDRLPSNIQKNVDAYISEAKKVSIDQINTNIEKLKTRLS